MIRIVNRAVAVIRPKAAYVDWANSLPDPVEGYGLEEARKECTTLLIPDYDFESDAEKFIEEHYSWIFRNELAEWWEVEADWPEDRDYRMFQDWFEVEFHSIVFDLVDGPVVTEE